METLLPANLTATSSEGSRTSEVAKLRRQKCWHGMHADSSNSSNVFFFFGSQVGDDKGQNFLPHFCD